MAAIINRIKEASVFFSTMAWCLSLSWKSSRFYTVARISAEILTPMLIIAAAFVGRHLINLLAGAWDAEEPMGMLFLLFGLQLAIALLISGSRKLSQYCQSMHEDMLGNKLSIYVMDNAISADVELFDNPEYPVSSLRANFSVYFQNMPSYSFTLRENLAIADALKVCADEEAEAAFSYSNGADILDKSPKRLDASLTRFIDSDGIELSAGEYQKVALARTFYRSHTALILDEPSSNLDPEAEDAVFHSLRKLSEGKLTIFTSHRLSNVSLADRILVLENGSVLEFGTSEELIKNKNRYAELYRYQRDKYIKGTSKNLCRTSLHRLFPPISRVFQLNIDGYSPLKPAKWTKKIGTNLTTQVFRGALKIGKEK